MTAAIRELFVKLGFKVDLTQFDKFQAKTEQAKASMLGLQKNFASKLTPETQETFNKIKAYKEEIAGLSTEEKKDLLELNRIEKQAISETRLLEREKYKEIKIYEDDLARKRKLNQDALRRTIVSSRAMLNKITIASAAISTSVLFGIKNTLKANKQIAQVNRFNESLTRTKKTLTGIRDGIVIGMLPSLTKGLNVINLWIQKNKDFLASFNWVKIIGTIVAIPLFAWLGRTAFQVGVLIKVVYDFIKTGAALRVLLLSIQSIPLVATITGLAAAFTLLYNEISVTVKGGDSLINRFLGSNLFGKIKEGIDGMITSLKECVSWFAKLFSSQNKLAGVNTNINQAAVKTMSKVSSAASYDAEQLAKLGANKTTYYDPEYNINVSINQSSGGNAETGEVVAKAVQAELERYNSMQEQTWRNAIGSVR